MLSLLFIMLLSTTAVILPETNQISTEELFDISNEDIKKSIDSLQIYVKGIAQQLISLKADQLAEFRKMFAQINEKSLNDNQLENFFFKIWYPKNKHVLTKEEQKRYETALNSGVLVGISENEDKVFSIIQLPNNEQYIIPSNLMFGFAELMMQRIPKAFEALKIVIEKEEDLTDEVFAKLFDKLAKDSSVESLLYDMLFMHIFQKFSHLCQKKVLEKIK